MSFKNLYKCFPNWIGTKNIHKMECHKLCKLGSSTRYLAMGSMRTRWLSNQVSLGYIHDAFHDVERWCWAEVDICAKKHGGSWRLLVCLEHRSGLGVVVHTAPGVFNMIQPSETSFLRAIDDRRRWRSPAWPVPSKMVFESRQMFRAKLEYSKDPLNANVLCNSWLQTVFSYGWKKTNQETAIFVMQQKVYLNLVKKVAKLWDLFVHSSPNHCSPEMHTKANFVQPPLKKKQHMQEQLETHVCSFRSVEAYSGFWNVFWSCSLSPLSVSTEDLWCSHGHHAVGLGLAVDGGDVQQPHPGAAGTLNHCLSTNHCLQPYVIFVSKTIE